MQIMLHYMLTLDTLANIIYLFQNVDRMSVCGNI